jgi:hypothetical protein
MNRITISVIGVFAALLPMAAFAQEELPAAPEVPPEPVSSSVLDGILLMSNESMIMLVAGVVLSMVSAVLFRQTWSDDIKAGLYFLICVAFGLIYTLTLDEWNTADAGRRILLVLVAGTLFYQLFKGPMQTATVRTDAMLNRTP